MEAGDLEWSADVSPPTLHMLQGDKHETLKQDNKYT